MRFDFKRSYQLQYPCLDYNECDPANISTLVGCLHIYVFLVCCCYCKQQPELEIFPPKPETGPIITKKTLTCHLKAVSQVDVSGSRDAKLVLLAPHLWGSRFEMFIRDECLVFDIRRVRDIEAKYQSEAEYCSGNSVGQRWNSHNFFARAGLIFTTANFFYFCAKKAFQMISL
jgi:hypothetical protein